MNIYIYIHIYIYIYVKKNKENFFTKKTRINAFFEKILKIKLAPNKNIK